MGVRQQAINLDRILPTAAALSIVLVTFLAYVPAMRGEFLWDDDQYITKNDTLHSLEGLGRIWVDLGATPAYYPLTFTSFWFEYHLWGMEPVGYHLVNVLLHALTAVLLGVVVRRLGIPGAWLAAAIFAVHPLHVESVAWIAERKNVLSSMFYLSSVLAYLRRSSPGADAPVGTARRSAYPLCLALYLCALFSKTATCSLPAAILLIIWWKRGRLTMRDVLPLLPMFVLGAGLAAATVVSEQRYWVGQGEHWAFSYVERSLIAGRAVWLYIGKLMWPSALACIYPKWTVDAGSWWQYVYPGGALLVVIVLWRLRSRVGRAPLATALFFGGTLLPTLGFFNVSLMQYTFVADHFQYLADLGPIILFAAFFARISQSANVHPARRKRSPPSRHVRAVLCTSIAGSYLILLTVLTWNQAKTYRNRETLWSRAVTRTPASAIAHFNLADEMLRQRRLEEAVTHFRAALRLDDHPHTRINLGSLLAAKGDIDEAIEHFKASIRLAPDQPDAHTNLGQVLAYQGRFDEALSHFEQALKIDPGLTSARLNMGHAFYRRGRIAEALEIYREAVRISPKDVDARLSLAIGLTAQDQIEQAIAQYREALRIDPNHSEARNRLNALLSRGDAP